MFHNSSSPLQSPQKTSEPAPEIGPVVLKSPERALKSLERAPEIGPVVLKGPERALEQAPERAGTDQWVARRARKLPRAWTAVTRRIRISTVTTVISVW